MDGLGAAQLLARRHCPALIALLVCFVGAKPIDIRTTSHSLQVNDVESIVVGNGDEAAWQRTFTIAVDNATSPHLTVLEKGTETTQPEIKKESLTTQEANQLGVPLAATTLLNKPPLAVLVVGAGTGSLPLVLSNTFKGSTIDVVDDDKELLSAIATLIQPTNSANNANVDKTNLRIMKDNLASIPRSSFYNAVFVNFSPCNQVLSEGTLTGDYQTKERWEEVSQSLAMSVDQDGVLVVPFGDLPTNSSCLSAVNETLLKMQDGNNKPLFRHAYMFGADENKAVAFHRGYGPLKFYTLFNTGEAMKRSFDIPFSLNSKDILPLEFPVWSNPLLLNTTKPCSTSDS